MDVRHISTELREVGAAMGRNKQAKGSMGKIRQYAKKHGEDAFEKLIQDLDEVTDSSRVWDDGQKDLFFRATLEEVQTRLGKELR